MAAEAALGALTGTTNAMIGAAGSLGSTMLANRGSKRSQERANRFNIDMWNRQNEYNNPTQQMARLKNAGLNPNMIYGTSPTSAVGNADSVAPSKAAEYNFDNPLKDINLVSAQKRTEAQTNNLESQNTVNEANAALLGSKQAGEMIKNDRSSLGLKLATELYNTSAEAQKMNLEQIKANVFGKHLDNYKISKGMKDQLSRIHDEANYAKANFQGQQKLNTLRQLEINLNRIGVQKSDSLWSRILGQEFSEEIKGRMKTERENWRKLQESFNRKN